MLIGSPPIVVPASAITAIRPLVITKNPALAQRLLGQDHREDRNLPETSAPKSSRISGDRTSSSVGRAAPQQLWRRRRREPSHALGAALAKAERHGERLDRDAQALRLEVDLATRRLQRTAESMPLEQAEA
jgi:hypothetical protein